MREYAKKPWPVKRPIASATESLPVYVSVSVVSEEVTEVIEETGKIDMIEAVETIVEVVIDEEEVAVLMTDEEATETRVHLLQEFATTDTEPLLQRAELTATSQAAHIETILPHAGAARLPTIAHAADPPPHQGAAAATPLAFRDLAHRRHARSADEATTGQLHGMSLTAKMTAKAKASVVMKAADPVRVLLLTSVAHDHPDVTANPTTPAAEGRPLTTVDPLLPKNATAKRHHWHLARHHH